MPDVSKVDADKPARRAKTGGRKKGTPNKTNAVIRAAIEDADPIAFLISVMRGRLPTGDSEGQLSSEEVETPTSAERIRAAEFLAKRIAPEVKETPIRFDLDQVSSPTEALSAMTNVFDALGSGRLLPSESKAILHMLNGYFKAYELVDLSERLDALEARLSEQAK